MFDPVGVRAINGCSPKLTLASMLSQTKNQKVIRPGGEAEGFFEAGAFGNLRETPVVGVKVGNNARRSADKPSPRRKHVCQEQRTGGVALWQAANRPHITRRRTAATEQRRGAGHTSLEK